MSERTPWTPTDLPPVFPPPATIVDLVACLVESDWPTTDEERQRWFREFGLRDAPDGVYWDSATEPGDAPTDWHTFQGEFVGAYWFIWTGWPREAVEAAAAELKERLTAAFGSPLFDELAPRGIGWNSLWKTNGRVVDMYFHSGRAPHARPDTAAFVQLHVDHEQRAAAQESAAQANSSKD